MIPNDESFICSKKTTIKDAVKKLNNERSSCLIVTDDNNNVKGIFSNNYFEMLPNEVVTIEFEPDQNLDGNDDEASFEIKSIYELMN